METSIKHKEFFNKITEQSIRKIYLLIICLRITRNSDYSVKIKKIFRRLERKCWFSGTVLKWCRDYPIDRSQAMFIGDTLSSSFSLRFGVPQGSILNSLLFLIFTFLVSNIVVSHTGVEEHQYSNDLQFRVRLHPSASSPTSHTKIAASLPCLLSCWCWAHALAVSTERKSRQTWTIGCLCIKK